MCYFPRYLYARSVFDVIGMEEHSLRRLMGERSNHTQFSTLVGWSGWAAALSGVLFLVWGYVDREGASWYLDLATLVLAIVVPLLFLAGLAGIYLKLRGRAGWLGLIGSIISLAGAAKW